jgi:hypothetical protein
LVGVGSVKSKLEKERIKKRDNPANPKRLNVTDISDEKRSW